MLKKQLLILLLIFWAQDSSGFLDDLLQAVKKGIKVVQVLNEVKFTTDNAQDIISLLIGADDNAEIMDALRAMDHKLDDLKAYMRDKQNYIALLIEQLPSELAIQSKKGDLNGFIVTTNHLWATLMAYIENGDEKLFHSLASDVLDEMSLPLQHFRQTITPLPGTISTEHDGLFRLIIENAHKKRDILCDQGETSHHSVVRLFYIIMSTEVKAFTLLFFANALEYSLNDAWRLPLVQQFRKQFHRYIQYLAESLKLTKLPYLRSCDPEVWKTDENYYAMWGYRQQTIYSNQGCSSPWRTCESLNSASDDEIKAMELDCPRTSHPFHSKCDGRPVDCIEVSSSLREVLVCPVESGPYRISFFSYAGEAFGPDREALAILKANGTAICYSNFYHSESIVHTLYHRRLCSCQCSESGVKLIMQLMHSNIKDNYVIVGLRIHPLGDYLYIQIAEGKLESNGYIADYSWVPSNRKLHVNWGANAFPAQATKTQNLFFFGDYQLPPGYALTGIQFGQLSMEQSNGFALLIHGMKFDYKTGKLNVKERMHDPVQRGGSEGFSVPTKSPINMGAYERSSPQSDGYTHVELQRSDLNDDYGQSTLPFLDGVPILTHPLSVIGGVGLFYKGYSTEYAGFLSLRIYPVSFTHFIEDFIDSYDLDSVLNWDD